MKLFYSITSVPHLPVELPERAILARLGHSRFRTGISPEEAVRFRLWMQKVLEACSLQGRWTLLPVTARTPESVTLDDSWCIESHAFAEFAGNAPMLWLGAVTAGTGPAELVQSAGGDMAQAVVFDAAGSEIADEAIGVLQKLARQALLRRGLGLMDRRFSIGYGGVELAHQREVFARLCLEELGMTLTESCIMQPEKSVTAFACVFGNDLNQSKG